MDEENTKLRNKLMEQNELIDLLHLTVHTTTKECEYNIKCEVEKKDSAMLFKVKLCWQLWCHNNVTSNTGEGVGVSPERLPKADQGTELTEESIAVNSKTN